MNRKKILAKAQDQRLLSRWLIIATALGLLFALLAVNALPASAGSAQTFPPVFNVPDGFQPEGIAVGRGSSFYVGSLFDGRVYKGDLRTGQGEVLVPSQAGRIAVGLAVDERSNAVFVAGGGPVLVPVPGSAYVYDGDTGAELAVYPLGGLFVNDVVVTQEAAYFTDSFKPIIYRVPLGPQGELPDPSQVQEIPLGDGFDFNPTTFNANGIEATPDGKTLIIANSSDSSIYRVDPLFGNAEKIDLGGATLTSADGLVLAGKTLYVVQNGLNQIGIVSLDPGLESGTVSDQPLTSPEYRIPTTAAVFGSTIYAVNARFGDWIPGLPSPNLEFTVVGLPMQYAGSRLQLFSD
jgi:sugar lactone lactonase YvrE